MGEPRILGAVAREIALLTNPSAGKGAGSRTAAIALPRLREAGFHVRELQGSDGPEALALAREAVAEGVESLVVVGGDGLVHMAVQALAGTDVNLGIIPAGTGNDVARYLDIPRKDPQAAADVVSGRIAIPTSSIQRKFAATPSARVASVIVTGVFMSFRA